MGSVLKGKRTVISIIIVMLLIEIVTIAVTTPIYASSKGMDFASFKLTQGIVRFLLTCLLLFFLYKGHGWAKWVIAILSLIGGVFSLILTIGSFNIVILLMGVIYTMISIVLIVSRDVKSFMKDQRGELTIETLYEDKDQV